MDDFIEPKKLDKSAESTVQPDPEPVAEAASEPLPIKKSFVAPAALKTNPKKPTARHAMPYFKHIRLTKLQWGLVILASLVLIVGGVLGGSYLYKHLTKTSTQASLKGTPRPKVEPSHLTGVLVDPTLNDRPVTGVMIENSPDARPQSGLTDAGVVVEAIAEGGITRFLALYQEAQPSYIGPVRSVRPYYLDFALGFNASVAHVGGSPEALKQVKGLDIRDLDQFYNAQAYTRITSRYAPHNVYTSFKKLDALNKAKGYKSSTFTSWPRKKDQPSTKPTVKSINMNISSFYYNTHYDYVAKTNTYKRSEGGSKHVDEKSKKQINPKVLVALIMNYSIESDGKHSQYGTIGSGKVFIFQDGIVIKGKWHKSSHSSQITFTNTGGKEIKLNAGQTWVTLLGGISQLSFK